MSTADETADLNIFVCVWAILRERTVLAKIKFVAKVTVQPDDCINPTLEFRFEWVCCPIVCVRSVDLVYDVQLNK